MNNLFKNIFFIFSLLALTFIGYKLIIGNYLATNVFNGILMLILLLFLFIFLIKMKIRGVLGILLSVTFLQSCDYAKSNQQVVVSDDCGMNWKKINPGDVVPKAGVNPCFMKVMIPNYPLQGESKFVGNLKDKVRASVHIDYDYSIIEPLAFIKQAKFLGKANVSADDEEAIGKSFEGAENMVIDKRIKDVAKNIFLKEDIVELDQGDLENELLIESNKVLEPLGIHLNFITLTFDLDEQTRQAIDVATAMKIYQSKNMNELGARVIIEKAGATKINLSQDKNKE